MESEGTTMAFFDESMNKSFAHQEPLKSHHPGDSAASDARPSENACFDCSICLDSAVEPVVTLCGHLYCWACIYKWLQVETTSPRQCPVCKCPLSQNALVPLYGRGSSNQSNNNKGFGIPDRPSVQRNAIAPSIHEQHLSSPQYPSHHHHSHYPSPWEGMGVFSSTAGGVLGGLAIAILPLVSRNSQGGGMYFRRMNRLAMNANNSPSQRLQERRVENSLHQIWMFLFCCAILCLLLF